MVVGDIVFTYESSILGPDGLSIGLVVESDINMWDEEVIPTGVRVLWSDGEVEIVYEDEVVPLHMLEGNDEHKQRRSNW